MKESDFPIPLHVQLIELWKNFIALLSDSLNLAKTESKLAKKSVNIIFWLFPTVLMFGLCSWLCCLGAIFSWLAVWGVKTPINFVFLAGLNALLMIGTKYLLTHCRKNLKFNKTRQLFYSKENSHEPVKKEAANVRKAN